MISPILYVPDHLSQGTNIYNKKEQHDPVAPNPPSFEQKKFMDYVLLHVQMSNSHLHLLKQLARELNEKVDTLT